MVPLADSDTEIAAISAGEVDFIFPQGYTGITEALADPNIEFAAAASVATTRGCTSSRTRTRPVSPFADADFRQAFVKSIDRDALFAADLRPDRRGSPAAAAAARSFPVRTATDAVFDDTYDPAGRRRRS